MSGRVTGRPWAVLLCLVAAPAAAQGIGTAFTYQGRLTDAGSPPTGVYDFQFTAHDAATGGSQVGPLVTRGDVSVTGGIFTVSLDFGAVFTGNARWLEIGVRPGASTGAYTALSPRQELTPAPHAVFAGNARTVAGLTCANGQVAKWSGAVWTCGADLDTNSGGTVTSVATGAGLTGGPITGSGTLSVASGGITSGMIAAGAVGLAQINQSQVQARVGGACPSGQYLRGINPDGTVFCEPFLAPNIRTLVDGGSTLSFFGLAIALGADGLPVIAYQDQQTGSVKLARCGDPTCTMGNTLVTVEDDPFDGEFYGDWVSLAVGPDGLPVLAYQATFSQWLRVAKCGDAFCGAGNVLTTVDGSGFAGGHISIAVPADGRPVISYRDAGVNAVKVAKCGNAACSAGNTFANLDGQPTDSVGNGTSIAIGADGLPVISYVNSNSATLRVAKCGNAACSAGNVLTTLDDLPIFMNPDSSLAVAPDGRPVVAYADAVGGVLRVAKCGNAACSTGNTVTVVEGPGYGFSPQVGIGVDGLPVVSYDVLFGSLGVRVARCGNALCSAGNTFTTLEDGSGAGALAVAPDGLPVIAYRDGATGGLKVAKCGRPGCR
jgi:hypothetical protein